MRIEAVLKAKGAKLPTRATCGATGYDLYSTQELTIYPGEVVKVSTGVSIIVVPEEDDLDDVTVDIQVRSRSGLSTEHGVVVVNSPGTIDVDYEGEIFVGLTTLKCEPYKIKKGDRIAQLVFGLALLPQIVERTYEDLLELPTNSQNKRGPNGFGSTGK